MITPKLIDARNWAIERETILSAVKAADFIGFDVETEDSNAHDGIKAFRKNKPTKAFDIKRTILTGFSVWPEGHEFAYYFNLAHADEENCLSFFDVIEVLTSKREDANFICHNATYEITMMRECFGFELKDVICSMQLAVSCYGPDNYDKSNLINHGLGNAFQKSLSGQIMDTFAEFDRDKGMTQGQGEVFAKFVGKTSDAKHSYNGIVKDVAYGYGLKKAVKSFFDYEMVEFDQVLGDKKHMGELTGEEVVSYGADDAYWCVRLFRRLLQFAAENSPEMLKSFQEQENPMIYVFADIWSSGMRVNTEAIGDRMGVERTNYAATLRELRAALQDYSFATEPVEQLLKERWYKEGKHQKYRDKLSDWITIGDQADDFDEVHLVQGSVASGWCLEKGVPDYKLGPNLTYYMMMRTLMYDLLQLPVVIAEGKIQSDKEARDRLAKDAGENEKVVLELIDQLAGIEQRMKLYLKPYSQLMDPETGCLYPTVSSLLATRRMASRNPNPMQLAKRGESTYVRGFFLPDNDEHLTVSIDWSQIELVLIGELSGDPEFAKAYGQTPYEDLHTGAAANCLGLTLEEWEIIKKLGAEEEGYLHIDFKGLTPQKWLSSMRTKVGKGANFNYWYSGALSTVGDNLGWSSAQMWKATEAYRERFNVAEEWRVGVIEKVANDGYILLPDGHRRVRYEATPEFAGHMISWFRAYNNPAMETFGWQAVRNIQRRAGNQAVNSLIQGSCATLAKRSILKIVSEIKQAGFDARFTMPIHDELVFSVNRREIVPFIEMAKGLMCNHPEIISNLAVDATASVGLTFEPYSPKVPNGQIELDECPELEFIDPSFHGKSLDAAGIEAVVDYFGHLMK